MPKLTPPPEGPTRVEQERHWNAFPVRNWSKTFVLPFPVMLNVAADVMDELHFGRGGHSYIAPTQFGKSTLIRYLLHAIPERYPNMLAVRLEFEMSKNPSQREFYRTLLRGLDPQLVLRHFLEDRRDQALAEYLALATPKSPPFIVFLVDEIQNGGALVLEWLKFFMGMLDECGVRNAAFGFGNSGLTAAVKKVRQAHQNHLLKRYFRRVLSMPGIANRMTLSRIFRIVDWAWRWTEFGWTISQFYFPQAFQAGWRITNESGLAWTALNTAAGAGGRGMEIGVDVVRDLLQYYLTQFSRFDSPKWNGTSDHWDEAAKACDLSLLLD
ncbi:ATP-binding protein [Lysobacter sp. D1-1-M9]|uniref:ATP-binding protein n=1 Tax=Novilysobacter longmucuonensis TaxID=3098603 RepID=UPI002FC871FB